MNDAALQLLQDWLAYYEGNRPSFGLKTRTEQMLKEHASRYQPTDEETKRMEENGET